MSRYRQVAVLDLNTLEEAVDSALSSVPAQAVLAVIKQKLKGLGIELTSEDEQFIIGSLANPVTQKASAKLASHLDRVITFDEKDWSQVNAKLELLQSGLSGLISKLIQDSSQTILARLKREWRAESKLQSRERSSFESRLYRRWKKPLELLRQFQTMSAEFGASIRVRASKDTSACRLGDTLTRLHAQALRISDEIFCLMTSGHPNGALARWRTVHEITVISHVLSEFGEEAAIRYWDHQFIRNKKRADEYHRVYGMTAEDLSLSQSRYDYMIAKYGEDFRYDYGWAANLLNKKKPNFRDLEECVDAGRYRPHYQWASDLVHAGPKGTFAPAPGDADIILVGPTNFGLADPGLATARLLLELAEDLAELWPTIDSRVILQMLQTLETEIADAFVLCQNRLENEDADLVHGSEK